MQGATDALPTALEVARNRDRRRSLSLAGFESIKP